jgi:hypothetical protein
MGGQCLCVCICMTRIRKSSALRSISTRLPTSTKTETLLPESLICLVKELHLNLLHTHTHTHTHTRTHAHICTQTHTHIHTHTHTHIHTHIHTNTHTNTHTHTHTHYRLSKHREKLASLMKEWGFKDEATAEAFLRRQQRVTQARDVNE